VADYHAHPAVPITSHTKRPHNPLDYTGKDGERRLLGMEVIEKQDTERRGSSGLTAGEENQPIRFEDV